MFELTKQEAVTAMHNNHKVAHESFRSGEYIYMKNGDICNQTNKAMPLFWAERMGPSWNKNWSIIL
jgi:hypothetical protein